MKIFEKEIDETAYLDYRDHPKLKAVVGDEAELQKRLADYLADKISASRNASAAEMNLKILEAFRDAELQNTGKASPEILDKVREARTEFDEAKQKESAVLGNLLKTEKRLNEIAKQVQPEKDRAKLASQRRFVAEDLPDLEKLKNLLPEVSEIVSRLAGRRAYARTIYPAITNRSQQKNRPIPTEADLQPFGWFGELHQQHPAYEHRMKELRQAVASCRKFLKEQKGA